MCELASATTEAVAYGRDISARLKAGLPVVLIRRQLAREAERARAAASNALSAHRKIMHSRWNLNFVPDHLT
jgi:hypothetical protein